MRGLSLLLLESTTKTGRQIRRRECTLFSFKGSSLTPISRKWSNSYTKSIPTSWRLIKFQKRRLLSLCKKFKQICIWRWGMTSTKKSMKKKKNQIISMNPTTMNWRNLMTSPISTRALDLYFHEYPWRLMQKTERWSRISLSWSGSCDYYYWKCLIREDLIFFA